jgi:hypothetical protein
MRYSLTYKFLHGGWWNKEFIMAEVSNNIPKIEKRIDNMVEKVGASEEGALWVKESLDPFCDQPRRVVGFPDLITGNSIVQVVKQSVQFNVGASAQDVHMFLDTMDTGHNLYQAVRTVDGTVRTDNWQPPAEVGMTVTQRGGLVIRSGAVGGQLTHNSTQQILALPFTYLAGGSTRVLSKAFEVHNTTNQLNIGGSVCVYRSAAPIPYGNRRTGSLTGAVLSNTNSFGLVTLTDVPISLSEALLNPGAQQWLAKDGCYNVAIMAAQTNEPHDEHQTLITARDAVTTANTDFVNSYVPVSNPGIIPQPLGTVKCFSPFFLTGAYFTGLPANSTLTVNLIYIIERFVDSTNLDLITMANPSPYYDPIALELYSKSAARLPHGVKASENADGDWIKNIADVLGSFGVPGMPLVKGAVDLWNGFNRKDDPASKVGRVQGASWTGPPKQIRARQPKVQPFGNTGAHWKGVPVQQQKKKKKKQNASKPRRAKK